MNRFPAENLLWEGFDGYKTEGSAPVPKAWNP